MHIWVTLLGPLLHRPFFDRIESLDFLVRSNFFRLHSNLLTTNLRQFQFKSNFNFTEFKHSVSTTLKFTKEYPIFTLSLFSLQFNFQP